MPMRPTTWGYPTLFQGILRRIYSRTRDDNRCRIGLLQFFRVGDWQFLPSALRCKRVTTDISTVFPSFSVVFPRCQLEGACREIAAYFRISGRLYGNGSDRDLLCGAVTRRHLADPRPISMVGRRLPAAGRYSFAPSSKACSLETRACSSSSSRIDGDTMVGQPIMCSSAISLNALIHASSSLRQGM